MITYADKKQKKNQSVWNEPSQKQKGDNSSFQLIDNRQEAGAQRKLHEIANNSPQATQLRAFQDMVNNSRQAKQAAKLRAMANNFSAQEQQTIQKKEDNTGLPDNLKTGIEKLSGISLDDVKVYRNSDKPGQLKAHAYARGTEIHLGPVRKKHLPHEAWHVVQQKQGRVKPTTQFRGKVNINDDAGLEKETDVMGEYATHSNNPLIGKKNISNNEGNSFQPVIQRVIYPNIPALLAAVWPGPGPVPNVAAFSKPLRELFADAGNQLALTDVIHAPGIGRIAEAGINPAPPPAYILSYDPAFGAPDFLLSSMLHELLHVSTQQNYRKNGVAFDFLNMNLPAGLGIPAAVGAEINAQLQILDLNLQDAVAVTNADVALAAPIRAHILNRLNNYALAMPDVHYDTVLADILAYMELNGINNGPAFAFITRLVKESTNRRLVNPWWGTKSARRVDRNTPAWQIWKW